MPLQDLKQMQKHTAAVLRGIHLTILPLSSVMVKRALGQVPLRAIYKLVKQCGISHLNKLR